MDSDPELQPTPPPWIYSFTRELLGPCVWDIDHPSRPASLAKEIENALPGKSFFLKCDGPEAKVLFDLELDAGEQATLSNVVATHKANA